MMQTNSVQHAYKNIDKDKCELYKNGKAFINAGARNALGAITGSDESGAKISLIVSFTGLELILKSLLLSLVSGDDKDIILSTNINLKITKEKVEIRPSEHTIDSKEILKRINDLGIDISKEINDKIKHIKTIRNEIVHHNTDKTIEEIRSSFIMIFELINLIISEEHEDFWEKSIWKKLCKQADVHRELLRKCSDSWQKINFTPNEYFSCLKCHSALLFINKESKGIECKECGVIFDVDFLSETLGSSVSFFQSHQIISMLELYLHCNYLGDRHIDQAIEARTNNSQLSCIASDADIANFFSGLPSPR